MKCYRIYTEDINRTAILKEASKRFPNGYTLFSGSGCWRETQESCLVIEIITAKLLLPTVHRLATDIKRINNQDAVLITETALTFSKFV